MTLYQGLFQPHIDLKELCVKAILAQFAVLIDFFFLFYVLIAHFFWNYSIW